MKFNIKFSSITYILDKNYLGRGACTTVVPTALDFDVTDFFVFGSALGNVIAYRKIRVNMITKPCTSARFIAHITSAFNKQIVDNLVIQFHILASIS